ncbi:MFS transporter [Ochrobactrum sp. Marseille-Q0166]|uniref:MFS transporter n=1 Tax=Ochrobactrum sp. Marseille-Q0166 TaxID=2761105 RepID=UPI001654DFDD|nr:MFS transporter [Ochrobactrum sp. Marseille-Q0166]MBC8719800.1 MFS transporter [Ochrobactrum sp. Marseille-Q0166]
MTLAKSATSTNAADDSLPLGGLLALALAGFVTLMTEVMPAGLLPQISMSLGIAESMAGQLVTAYAAGSLITAIPLMMLTQAMRRRGLLLVALGGFAVVNTVTALSDHYWVTLTARFFAGIFGGMVWALIVGYAARMVPSHLAGRAIAITGIGGPLAFTIGVPAGTWLGVQLGWRVSFGLMSVFALALIAWSLIRLPDFAGQPRGKQYSIRQVVTLPGLRPILFVLLAFVVAHNILYTYIAPFLAPSSLADRVDLVLLTFGVAGVFGLWIVGALIDRNLRRLVLGSLIAFATVAFALGVAGTSPVVVLIGVVVWGLVMGGAPTLFQTAEAKAAGDATDVAQAMFVTVWNTGLAGGGLIGGILLDGFGVASFPWAVFALTIPALVVSWLASKHGFPPASQMNHP